MEGILLLWTLSLIATTTVCSAFESVTGTVDHQSAILTREFLLSFRHNTDPNPNLDLEISLPADYFQDGTEGKTNKRKKKRGSRGGVRERIRRRGSRFPLPTITLSNTRSLDNKTDELAALLRYDSDFRRCNILCFTETWLHDGKDMNMEGYTCIRADRNNEQCGKKGRGGGVCMLVSERWATSFTVREQVCTRDYEILTVSFRPFYLPREFGQITMILAYCPGPNFNAAAEKLAESYHTAITRAADQPVFILGDLNKCKLASVLPDLHQYVTVKTRYQNTLDVCYGNIKDAYVSVSRPALGLSDHNVIHLLPKYKQRVKTTKPQKTEKLVWDPESISTLQNCFETTDWDVFLNNCNDPEELVHTVTGYITFCEDKVVKKKAVTVFPNNKPWVTKDLKFHLSQKKAAFLSGDMLLYKEKTKEFNKQAKLARQKYKDKVEEQFTTGNVKEAWEGLKIMMGKSSGQSNRRRLHSAEEINDLNRFYARFDVRDTRQDCDSLCESLAPECLDLSEEQVVTCFKRLKPNKAPGPDHITGRLLRSCANELGHIFHVIFQMLLNLHTMPRSWKTSTIIPIPKSPSASQPNDFRPVALTSVLAKCFESVVRQHLLIDVAHRLDPLQFAYKACRGTDDACLALFHLIAKHLDKSKTYVRILMIDFSSAFNCMEPFVLLKRMVDLGINNNIVRFVNSFLRDRPQRVSSGGSISDEIIVNVGAPQGCVLSPTLFSIYTDEIRFNSTISALFKFADDMALVGLLHDEDSLASYYANIHTLATWCTESYLELNVKKTKELVFDERKSEAKFVPIVIANEAVEVTETFKYLGTVLDTKLTFSSNVDFIYKRAQQRLYLLRKLKSFNVSTKTLGTAYRSLIESILTYNIVCWFGSLGVKDHSKLARVVCLAGKIIGSVQQPLEELYHRAVRRKTSRILSDKSHPLFSEFQSLPSGRRYVVPMAKKNKFKRSFIPQAVSLLNSKAQLSSI